MKTGSILLMLSLSALLVSDFDCGVEATKMHVTGEKEGETIDSNPIMDLSMDNSRIHHTRSYKQIDKLLSKIQRNVRNELTTTNNHIRKSSRKHTNYSKRLKSYKLSMRRFRSHMRSAVSNYHKYNRLYKHKKGEASALYASLRRQRVFIRHERRYINRMEKEALSLRKYSSQYKVIRKEIRQMRVQVNREIRDVERAYAIVRRKVSLQQRRMINKRNHQSRIKRRYQTLYRKYARLHKQYRRSLIRMSKTKNLHRRNKKEIIAQLHLLDEMRTLLRSYKPGTSGSRYKRRYVKCMRNYRSLKKHYSRMNCTRA